MNSPIIFLFLLTVHALVANHYMNEYARRKHQKVSPIKGSTHESNPSREGFSGRPNRLYIVYGGSSFIGSWFVRYLLLRGELVTIIDTTRPPADLLRNNAFFYQSPMNNNKMMEDTLMNLFEAHWRDNAEVIVYNCSCVRNYQLVRHHSQYDPGLRAIEVLLMNLRPYTAHANFTIINIGDTLCERAPVHWMRWWDRRLWTQKSPRDDGPRTAFEYTSKKDVATIYGWYQGAIECLVLGCGLPGASIRSEGIVTGHLGDNQLTPTILNAYGYLHNWGVPVNFLHVEDLVRAGLALEYRLLDPDTRQEFNGEIFSISGAQPTTLEHVYDYIKQRRPTFKAVRVHPVVVWGIGWMTSFFTMLFSSEKNSDSANMFSGPVRSLTLARFFTVQCSQRRNKLNTQRAEEKLKFRVNFHSVGPMLDEMIEEVEMFELKRTEVKDKAKDKAKCE